MSPMKKEIAMQTTGTWTNLRATATGATVLGNWRSGGELLRTADLAFRKHGPALHGAESVTASFARASLETVVSNTNNYRY